LAAFVIKNGFERFTRRKFSTRAAGNGIWLQGAQDPWRFFIWFDFGASGDQKKCKECGQGSALGDHGGRPGNVLLAFGVE
jgi:hypothetical protein